MKGNKRISSKITPETSASLVIFRGYMRVLLRPVAETAFAPWGGKTPEFHKLIQLANSALGDGNQFFLVVVKGKNLTLTNGLVFAGRKD